MLTRHACLHIDRREIPSTDQRRAVSHPVAAAATRRSALHRTQPLYARTRRQCELPRLTRAAASHVTSQWSSDVFQAGSFEPQTPGPARGASMCRRLALALVCLLGALCVERTKAQLVYVNATAASDGEADGSVQQPFGSIVEALEGRFSLLAVCLPSQC